MKLIVLYGPPAAGKYTIARAVAEKTGYKLFHNHLTVDLLQSVFTFGSPGFFSLSQKIRLDIFEHAAKVDIPGIVFTFVYEKPTDDAFVQRLIARLEPHGAEIVFIQLYCEQAELRRRVTAESRKQFRKLRSEEGLLRMLASGDQTSAMDSVPSTKIDSTHLTVDETVAAVLDTLNKQP